MKKMLTGAFLIAALASNCLITDAIGIKPSGAKTGLEAKQDFSTQIMLGWVMGCEMFVGQNKNLSGVKCSKIKNYQEDALTAYLFGPSFTAAKEDAFYKNESVEACSSALFTGTMINTWLWLETNFSTTTGLSQSNFDLSAILGPMLASSSCELEETGKVVELGPLSL